MLAGAAPRRAQRPGGCTAVKPSARSVALHARRPTAHRWWPESWDAPPPAQEEVITIFTADGQVVNIPPIPLSLPQRTPHPPAPLPAAAQQELCIGSVFSISATNGIDSTRRINVVGWCQSVEMLHETVEATVARRGGEVFHVQREGGMYESLSMRLAMPLLWGVPPEHERLRSGIESGGGIIDRIVREFFIQGS